MVPLRTRNGVETLHKPSKFHKNGFPHGLPRDTPSQHQLDKAHPERSRFDGAQEHGNLRCGAVAVQFGQKVGGASVRRRRNVRPAIAPNVQSARDEGSGTIVSSRLEMMS
jgi:hypothetical protein